MADQVLGRGNMNFIPHQTQLLSSRELIEQLRLWGKHQIENLQIEIPPRALPDDLLIQELHDPRLDEIPAIAGTQREAVHYVLPRRKRLRPPGPRRNRLRPLVESESVSLFFFENFVSKMSRAWK